MKPRLPLSLIVVLILVIFSCKKENNPPSIVDQIFSVKENSTPGLVCATVNATDSDGDKLNYELISNEENLPFEIDSKIGNIKIKQNASLDFEKVQQYRFQVKVSDGSESCSAIITITIADQMENPNVVDQSLIILENITGIYSLGVIKFESRGANDEYNFIITEGNNSNLFFIGEQSGELFLTVGKMLDYEVANKYSLQIKIQNKTNPSFYTIVKCEVTVTDVNEKPVVVDQTFSILENSENNTAIGTVVATDPDKGQQLSYSILQTSLENAIKLDAGNGKLLISDKTKFDYEETQKITLAIKVTDNANVPLSDTINVVVNILDVDERPSISTQKLQVNENSSSGQVVGSVIAKSYSGAPLEYAILSGDGSDKFVINKSTGQVTVLKSEMLNYELKKSYSLTVKVSETINPEIYAIGTVIIELIDVNETPVTVNQEFNVKNTDSGTQLCGIFKATDPDIGQALSYSITNGNTDGYFSINSQNGEILLTKPVDMMGKVELDFKLLIRVTDNGINSLFSEAEAVIKVSTHTIPGSGLIAYYPFNSNATDESINSYDGNVLGPVITDDRKGNTNRAYSFDGINDYINLSSLVGNGVRTISLWFRLDINIDNSLVNANTLIAREGDYNNYSEFSLCFVPFGSVGIANPGKLRFFYCVNKTYYYDIESNSTSWEKDRWYHIVAIIHPSEGMKMYIDNVKQADTTPYFDATEDCSLNTYVGSWGTEPNRYFEGKIDDVIFYNRALTEAEINELYHL